MVENLVQRARRLAAEKADSANTSERIEGKPEATENASSEVTHAEVDGVSEEMNQTEAAASALATEAMQSGSKDIAAEATQLAEEIKKTEAELADAQNAENPGAKESSQTAEGKKRQERLGMMELRLEGLNGEIGLAKSALEQSSNNVAKFEAAKKYHHKYVTKIMPLPLEQPVMVDYVEDTQMKQELESLRANTSIFGRAERKKKISRLEARQAQQAQEQEGLQRDADAARVTRQSFYGPEAQALTELGWKPGDIDDLESDEPPSWLERSLTEARQERTTASAKLTELESAKVELVAEINQSNQ